MGKKNIKITVEDESRLEKILQIRSTKVLLILFFSVFLIVIMGLGVFFFAITPVKKILPGYLSESERFSTEEQHLRLDSLTEVMAANSAFLDNFRKIINNDRDTVISTQAQSSKGELNSMSDSLSEISPEEKAFLNNMREREKYNAKYIAPIVAEGIRFFPVNNESIISQSTRNSHKAEIILPKDSYIATIADGIVLAVSSSFDKDELESVIIQHPKGFVSRYSRLGSCIVKPGDNVTAGQVIGLENKTLSSKHIYLEMWHNGSSLIPFYYFNDASESEPLPKMDLDVGRGRI